MNSTNRTSSQEADLSLKQETHHDKTKKASTSSSTTSNSLTAQWLRSKDPRIVRVSRAFGGKDRHSKVCTVKGLRDRRVRLSVSTAIQLYDLQDRLGFNQPSKVVDWLLDAAKHEIDELPPLQIPPGSFNNFSNHQPSLNINNEVASTSQQNEQDFNINESLHHHSEGLSSIMSRSKGEGLAIHDEKTNWNRREEDEEDHRDNVLTRGNNNHQQNHPSFLGLLNTMPFGYNVNNNQWEANSSSSDVSHHSGNNLGFANIANIVPFSSTLSSTLSLSTGPIMAHHHQPYFPSNLGAIMDMDHQNRRMNQHQYQMLLNSSNSQTSPLVVHNDTSSQQQPTKPFSLTMMMGTPKLFRSPPMGKDQVFPSK